MLRSIRRGVFETNSSSTHSITIVSKKDYDAWERGEMLLDRRSEELVKKGEKVKYPDELQTYEDYFNEEYLETLETSYTTKLGEEVVAFGKYGYEG
jgi:hypothetical protein